MTKLILHVEDDENDALLLQHAIRKTGQCPPIHVASDGQQAIDYFEGAGKFANRDEFPLPSLVLLDLKLPLVSGLEVLKWMRRDAGLSIPIIIFTSSENEADIVAAYDLGANGYLVKPSDIATLAEMTKTITDFWLALNHLPTPTPMASARNVSPSEAS